MDKLSVRMPQKRRGRKFRKSRKNPRLWNHNSRKSRKTNSCSTSSISSSLQVFTGDDTIQEQGETDSGLKRKNHVQIAESPIPLYQTTEWPLGDTTKQVQLTTSLKLDRQAERSVEQKRQAISSIGLDQEPNMSRQQKKKAKRTKRTETNRLDSVEIDPTGLSDTGSPRDPTPRKPVNVEDLDLSRSYVDDYIVLPSIEDEVPCRQTRWSHPGPKPLTDPTKLPKGWNTKEPDLDKK